MICCFAGKGKTDLQVEAHNGLGPALPYSAGVFAFVVQDVREMLVVSFKGVLLLIEVPSSPAVVVDVP